VSISGGTGAPTDAKYVVYDTLNGTLSGEMLLAGSADGIDLSAYSANGTLTISFDATEVGTETWGSGSAITWTFDASAGTDAAITFGDGVVNVSAGTLQQGGNAVYYSGGTDVTLGDGGTGASLGDPGADRILFWDDSAGAVTWLTAGTGLTVSTTTISADLGTAIDTSEITDDTILAADLNATNTEADNDILTYDSASGGFTFNTPSEIITAGTNISWSGTTLNVDDAFIINSGDDTTSGEIQFADQKGPGWGSDNDWNSLYDETTDDRLEFVHTAGAGADVYWDLNDNAADSTFTITNTDSTYEANVDIEGDLTVGGTLTVSGGTESFIDFTSNGSSPSGAGTNSIYVVSNVFKLKEGGSEKDIVTPGDSVTWSGATLDASGVTNFLIPYGTSATADAAGEIAIDSDDEQFQLAFGAGPTVIKFDFTGDSNGYVLKSNGSGVFTLQADATGGSPTWDTVGDPVADASISHDAGEETSFIYGGNFTTGSQFLIHQTGGDPSGGILFEVKADDSNVTVAQFGDGTNVWKIAQDGRLSNFGGADLNFAAASDLLIGGSQISSDALSDVASIAMLDEAETISADWDNTANPWADNEVSDTITVGSGGSVDDAAIPAGVTRDTEWDTESEVETAWGSVNILLETEIDASSELAAIMDDETGSGALVFGTSPTISGATLNGNTDASGGDFALPTVAAGPAAPDADGEIELDFADGSVVVQWGNNHAELASSTDVVIGKLIHSFAATVFDPDTIQSTIDQIPLKAIESSEFPHGIVITDIYLKTDASSTYSVDVENWDDPTTINASNGTIDTIATSSSSEVQEDTITYATIGAGQIIMLDLPTTDINWFYIQVEYYEPIA